MKADVCFDACACALATHATASKQIENKRNEEECNQHGSLEIK